MADPEDASLLSPDWPEIVRKIRARTPARLLVGRVGAAYLTRTQMDLRDAHAAARDAVRTELDLGRHFSDASRAEIKKRCPSGCRLQIAIGDGLSVTAVSSQIPPLLPLLHEGALAQGWNVGQTFVIRHCRVGILNEIGELLAPDVAVLLIGERPGLATAESLSAYMAYRPQGTHTDADRNLVSNIHSRGVRSKEAALRILNLAGQMMNAGMSGCQLREDLRALGEK